LRTQGGWAWPPEFIEIFNLLCMNLTTNANPANQRSGKTARRRRQRSKAAGQQTQAGAKKAQQPTQQNPSRQPRQGPRRRPRGRRGAQAPLGRDLFGFGWEEKSGMTGVGQTRSIRTSKRDMVIEESEFVSAVTVAGQPNFNNKAYPINPGQSALFPWLSTIAKQFEKYQFEKLTFVYKKEVSEYATAGQTGKVIMSVDFDAADPPPGTKQQMEDTIPHADAMPCQSFSLPLAPRDLAPTATDAKFVRVGGLPGATDIKTYDVGNLNVATQGITSNSEVGELHVVYRVRLMKPILENLAGAPANNQVTQFISSAGEVLTTATDYQILFADVTSADGFANGLNIVNTAGSMVPPPGNYLVDVMVYSVNSGNGTEWEMTLEKNGAAYPLGCVSIVVLPSGANGRITNNATAFVSANGTDAFTVIQGNNFSTGSSTIYGLIRWTAV